jgi:hypothetical protein
MMLTKLHVLSQNGGPVLVQQKYVIGFPSVVHARKVQYGIDLALTCAIVPEREKRVLLVVQKSPAGLKINGFWDGNITVEICDGKEVVASDAVIPYELLEEDDEKFVFRSYIT